MDFQVGTVVDVTNTHGTQRYLVTNWSNGGFTMRKCMLGKTKISAVRFPDTISLIGVAKTFPIKPIKKDKNAKRKTKGK